jgi:uncharacterized membrane protein
VAHCQKCGNAIPADARFCNKCGQEQPAAAWQPAQDRTGLSENGAACLSYVLGWITGIIFYLIDKRPYVRFHAAQSIVTFAGLHIIRSVIAGIFGFGWFMGGWHRGPDFGSFGPGIALISMIGIAGFFLWIYCMVKAYKGERFMLPIAGEIALNLANK